MRDKWRGHFDFSTVNVFFLSLLERGDHCASIYRSNFLNPSNIDHFRAILYIVQFLKNDKKLKKMAKNVCKKSFWSILVEKRSPIFK